MPRPPDRASGPAAYADAPEAVRAVRSALDAAPDALAAAGVRPRSYALAVSGGLDSMVLLASAATLPGPVRVLHVDHGLAAGSGSWARHVCRSATERGLRAEVLTVEVEEAGEGLEAAARTARYGAFEAALDEGEVLLTAQHADDQIETLFLRLLRGAGPAGLAGMPALRPCGPGWLLRPFLALPRAVIAAAAEALAVEAVEDPANADLRFDRVWLRRELLPRIEARWPGYRQPVLRAGRHAGSLEAAVGREALAGLASGEPLPLERLALAGGARGAVLRSWLAHARVAVPSGARLEELLRQLDAGERVRVAFGPVSVRRHGDALHLVAEAAKPRHLDRAVEAPGRWRLDGGELVIEAARGDGLSQARCGARLRLRRRREGDRCRPAGRGHSAPLKILFQEHAVPAWERPVLPLLCSAADGAVVAVADHWVCEGFQARADEPSWRVRWLPA